MTRWSTRRIRDREIQLKTKRARLAHRSALENWNQAPFGGQLNYRWPITQELPRRTSRPDWARHLMLQPTNRLTLIDAMRPPAGLRPRVGDGRDVHARPASVAGGPGRVRPHRRGRRRRRRDASTSRSSCSMPCASHAGKITVFSQVGEIALPPSRRVFAFLERSVVPVRAPLGGVVHPKVWVLRYEALDERPVRRRAPAARARSPAATSPSTRAGTPCPPRRVAGRQWRRPRRRSATCSRA